MIFQNFAFGVEVGESCPGLSICVYTVVFDPKTFVDSTCRFFGFQNAQKQLLVDDVFVGTFVHTLATEFFLRAKTEIRFAT